MLSTEYLALAGGEEIQTGNPGDQEDAPNRQRTSDRPGHAPIPPFLTRELNPGTHRPKPAESAASRIARLQVHSRRDCTGGASMQRESSTGRCAIGVAYQPLQSGVHGLQGEQLLTGPGTRADGPILTCSSRNAGPNRFTDPAIQSL